jgi:hypothetical protein
MELIFYGLNMAIAAPNIWPSAVMRVRRFGQASCIARLD